MFPGSAHARFGFVALALALALSLWCMSSRAEGSPLDGTWSESPLHEEYTVQQWLPGCGPAPVSSTIAPKDVVTIKEDSDELTITGGGRIYKTNQCYDTMQTLARDAHSRDPSGRAWRTRCATPAADPRHATVSTIVTSSSDTHLDLLEWGHYEIVLAEGKCIADVKRTRTFDRISAAPSTPSAAPPPAPPPPSPAPPAARDCSTPGDPARLEVRPAKKLLRTGESFSFRAVVTDADGCATSTPTSWSVAAGSTTNVSVDSNGKVSAASDAAEGAAQIVASAAGKNAKVTIDVASPERYAELLAGSGLNALGESDTSAVTELATGSIHGGSAAVEDAAKHRKIWFLSIIGVLAVALGGAAFTLAKKQRRAEALRKAEDAQREREHAEALRQHEDRRRQKKAAHDVATREYEESLRKAHDAAKRASEWSAAKSAQGEGARKMCPACRREYGPQSMYCTQDSARLVPIGASDRPASPTNVCPTCRRAFDPSTKRCPHDGDELVPQALLASRPQPPLAPPAPRGKICPTCGARSDGAASFCGKDGTALVLVN